MELTLLSLKCFTHLFNDKTFLLNDVKSCPSAYNFGAHTTSLIFEANTESLNLTNIYEHNRCAFSDAYYSEFLMKLIYKGYEISQMLQKILKFVQ